MDVLELTPAAFVDSIVVTERLHSLFRRREYFLDGPSRESLAGVERCPHAIARRGPWNEHDDAVSARDAVASRGNAVDRHFDGAHRSPSSRATRVQASWAGAPIEGLVGAGRLAAR